MTTTEELRVAGCKGTQARVRVCTQGERSLQRGGLDQVVRLFLGGHSKSV